MKTLTQTNLRMAMIAITSLGMATLSSCTTSGGYYGSSAGYYDSTPIGYGAPYYGGRSYRYNDHRYHSSHRGGQYDQRDSAIYHRNAGRGHDHPVTTSSDKIRLVNYREDKKSSHPSGYHNKDYWKSRGYSVKKNTFEKKDGKIVGSRKNLSKSNSRKR